MASLVGDAYRIYRHIFFNLADRRSDHWLLAGSPLYPIAIVTLYLYLVNTFGFRFMKNRPAYNLDKFIAVYNIAQIICSFLLFYTGATLGWGTNLRFICEPLDFSDNPMSRTMAIWTWSYYILKIVDLIETGLFILRKKNSQVTFLHIYHHAGMVIFAYMGVRFAPGGHGVICGSINCLVHTIMYMYYFITNMWPDYKKNIWWKKYITQIQLVQFVVLILHSLPVILMKDCKYPAFAGGLIAFQNSVIFFLFYRFYRRNYGNKKMDA